MSLRLAFTEGFAQDAVVAQVDGKEVRSSGPIATRRDVEPPLAWSVDVPVTQPVVTVRVSIPAKNVAETIQLDVRQFPQLNVSVVGGRLVLRGAPFTPSIG